MIKLTGQTKAVTDMRRLWRCIYRVSASYSLADVVHRCTLLLSHATASLPPFPSPDHPLSDDIRFDPYRSRGTVGEIGELVEEVTVPGLGIFRAFEGGHIRVRFEDCTILQMARGEGLCRLLLPDAIEVKVPLHRWKEGPDAQLFVRYGAAAVQFMKWAFMSVQQREETRARSIHKAQRIEQELRR